MKEVILKNAVVTQKKERREMQFLSENYQLIGRVYA